jgi:signal transduction histidine kinase
MRITWCKLFLFLFLGVFSEVLAESLPDTIILTNQSFDKIELSQAGYVVNSPEENDPFVVWKTMLPKGGKLVSSAIGFSRDIFWIGFTAKNVSPNVISCMIEIDNPQIDYVDIYSLRQDSLEHVLSSGDKIPFYQRAIAHRNFLVPFLLSPGETKSFMIKLDKRNSTVVLPVYLWNAQQHAETDYKRNLGYGLYFGFIGLCLLYALMAFFFLRKSIYIWYFLLVTATAIYLLTALGFSFQYGYPTSTDFNSKFRVYLEVVSSIILLQFSERFLKISVYAPFIQKALRYLLIIFVALIVSSFVAYDFFSRYSLWVLPALNSLMLLSGLLIILAAILSYPKQKLTVIFFFTAFGMLLAGYGSMALSEFGIINVEKFPFNPVMIGSSIEIFIFSLALSYQIKKLYDERNLLSLRLADQQKAMLKSYIEGVERERVRIGRELHDDIGSRLSSLKRFISKHDEGDGFLHTQLDKLNDDIRTMSHQLAPQALQMAGLKKLLYELGYQTEQATSLKVDIQFYDFPDQLPEEMSTQLYRIAQEAINNVVKHAQASHIDLQFFGYADELVITIDDDGSGISAIKNEGIGIQNMKARVSSMNGTFEMSSKPGRGTSLLVKIPLITL